MAEISEQKLRKILTIKFAVKANEQIEQISKDLTKSFQIKLNPSKLNYNPIKMKQSLNFHEFYRNFRVQILQDIICCELGTVSIEWQNLHKVVACQHLKLNFVIHRGASAAGP